MSWQTPPGQKHKWLRDLGFEANSQIEPLDQQPTCHLCQMLSEPSRQWFSNKPYHGVKSAKFNQFPSKLTFALSLQSNDSLSMELRHFLKHRLGIRLAGGKLFELRNHLNNKKSTTFNKWGQSNQGLLFLCQAQHLLGKPSYSVRFNKYVQLPLGDFRLWFGVGSCGRLVV